MTHDMHRAGFLGRIWQLVLGTSEAAVAIHYHAPWLRAEAGPVRAARVGSGRQAGGTCAA